MDVYWISLAVSDVYGLEPGIYAANKQIAEADARAATVSLI